MKNCQQRSCVGDNDCNLHTTLSYDLITFMLCLATKCCWLETTTGIAGDAYDPLDSDELEPALPPPPAAATAGGSGGAAAVSGNDGGYVSLQGLLQSYVDRVHVPLLLGRPAVSTAVVGFLLVTSK